MSFHKCKLCGKPTPGEFISRRFKVVICLMCEKNIKDVPKKLSICPICRRLFYNYRLAHIHALENGHYGNYNISKKQNKEVGA